MSRFLHAVTSAIPEKEKSDLSEKDLKSWGLEGITLRSYQLDGVRWLTQCLKNQEGCILGDEMGLGKTCQTISLLAFARGALGHDGPFLILSPLSVLENWRQELQQICPSLSVVCYSGDKERRAELQRELLNDGHHVLLTTYEMCLKDAKFLKRWRWRIVVVDEAHRLKNQSSLLHQTLSEFSVHFRVLLTGTPIQNDLREVYSLLSFLQPSLFPEQHADDFVSTYTHVQTQPALADELHQVLQPFLLRRVKAEVAADLPKKMELLVYHGMSALQKRYYKAILMRDLDAFGGEQSSQTRLLNILMQLRKCVNHPYLFDGVEPEPFEMGEHLVEASGKLLLLDSMLAYLQEKGHRVLLFSQMTRMLDILQDYLEYRGYSYERLDGSVRGEERNLAIKNFSTKHVFIFMLSTKAGGVGMNLTAADTVIFMDSDFNPQNDLQAAARAHRIGQTRAVKVIRLVGRDTVEEIIYGRAMSKLRLTETVMEEGRFSLLQQAQSAASGLQLSEIVKFGLDKLLETDESSIQEVDLRSVLGASLNGHWLSQEEEAGAPTEEEEDETLNAGQNHMYCFEGKDYSKNPSTADHTTFDLMLKEQQALLEDDVGEGRALRHKGVLLSGPLASPLKRKRPLTESELELRRQKRQEAAAKRAKLQEERKRKQEEEKHKKKMAWWKSCGYRSRCLPSADSEDEEDYDEDRARDIAYVLGDVTHPHAGDEDIIIVHCVDDSGHWGRGGLFTALQVRSDEPRKQYELAGDMEDLELGKVLLFPIDDKQSRPEGHDHVALIVAQQRDQAQRLSGIQLPALDQALRKISIAALNMKASVHLPRIGHATKGFNWYGTERLIRKHLTSRGVPTSIYYYKRPSTATCAPPTATASTSSSTFSVKPAASPVSSRSLSPEDSVGSSEVSKGQTACSLADFMHGVRVFFYNLMASERKRLARHLVAYDGDEEEVMGPQVTHVVAEVDGPIHTQELRALVLRYPDVLPVQKDWLDACFSKQRAVDASMFLLRLE